MLFRLQVPYGDTGSLDCVLSPHSARDARFGRAV